MNHKAITVICLLIISILTTFPNQYVSVTLAGKYEKPDSNISEQFLTGESKDQIENTDAMLDTDTMLDLAEIHGIDKVQGKVLKQKYSENPVTIKSVVTLDPLSDKNPFDISHEILQKLPQSKDIFVARDPVRSENEPTIAAHPYNRNIVPISSSKSGFQIWIPHMNSKYSICLHLNKTTKQMSFDGKTSLKQEISGIMSIIIDITHRDDFLTILYPIDIGQKRHVR